MQFWVALSQKYESKATAPPPFFFKEKSVKDTETNDDTRTDNFKIRVLFPGRRSCSNIVSEWQGSHQGNS